MRHLILPGFCLVALAASCSNSVSGKKTGDGDGDDNGESGGTGTTASTGGSGDMGGMSGDGDESGATSGAGAGSGTGGSETITDPPDDSPPAGNPAGSCAVPQEAGLEDVSDPTTVIGEGTPESCTGQAVVDAVALGGVITFDCGDKPVTITLPEAAKVFNDANDVVVIDGGGLVTLSGGGTHRILYMNTCDEAQHYTTAACQDQDHPRLTVQNITFADGNSINETIPAGQNTDMWRSGGAIYASGGRFKAVNARFFNNHAPDEGPDIGGGALRVLQQSNDLPANLVNCTFGGANGYGNSASNGGAISSIGVSWNIYNSVLSNNSALGKGGNPAQSGTPGGGSGGAIYNDGNDMTLNICGTLIQNNNAKSFGDAIFFMSNDLKGDIVIADSVISDNCGGTWHVNTPSIAAQEETPIDVTSSEITACGQ